MTGFTRHLLGLTIITITITIVTIIITRYLLGLTITTGAVVSLPFLYYSDTVVKKVGTMMMVIAIIVWINSENHDDCDGHDDCDNHDDLWSSDSSHAVKK